FFFSSRRRHTRSKRDWSSDVCSSDLDCFSDIRGISSPIIVINFEGENSFLNRRSSELSGPAGLRGELVAVCPKLYNFKQAFLISRIIDRVSFVGFLTIW